MFSFRRIATLAAALILGAATASPQTVTGYRYWPNSKRGDDADAFFGEVPLTATGKVYRVEHDAAGRLTKVTVLGNGRTTSAFVYHYSGTAALPDSSDIYAATGELTGKHRILRNADGNEIRIDNLTALGELTGYTLRSIKGDEVEVTVQTAAGVHTKRDIYSFAPSGLQVRDVWFANDSTQYDSDIQEQSGLTLGRKKIVAGTLESFDKYTYDGNDLRRTDIYDAAGAWYGAREYSDGLQLVTRYKFPSGTEEIRYSYDDKRVATEAKFFQNDTLVCTFRFDRLSNGAIKRTLALGPNGDLYAEYPDMVVSQIDQNGHPLDHPDVGTIYKTGPWW